MINWGDKENPLYLAYQRIQEEREVGRSLAQRERSDKIALIDTGLVIAANIIKDIQKKESDPVNTDLVNYKKMWEGLKQAAFDELEYIEYDDSTTQNWYAEGYNEMLEWFYKQIYRLEEK